MSTRMLFEIERKMEALIDRECQKDEWPNVYIYSDLAKHMAQAAYAVFCANVAGQQEMEKQQNG